MATEDIKRLSRRIVEEMWNTRNLGVIDGVCAPSPNGHEGIKQLVGSYLAAFPDGQHTIHYQVAEGDTVVTRYTGAGTHLGQLADIPPTGERSTVEAVEVHRFAEGKLVEAWNSVNPATAYQPLRMAANRTLARRWYDEYINQHNVDALDDLLTPDFTSHFLSGAPGRSANEIKQIDGAMFAAFPDLHCTVEDLVTEADRVAVRYASRGTHLGATLGVPATGKVLTGTGMEIFRIQDGKIAERWAEMDFTGLLHQIGALSQST